MLGIVGVSCVAMGLVFAPFILIVQSIFYIIVSYTQSYYGEVFLSVVTIITCVSTAVTWLKNRNKSDKSHVIVNKIKPLEYVLIIPAAAFIGVACYFMLGLLGTIEVLTSTISMVAYIVASYLVIRRSAYYSVSYILYDVMGFLLWIFTIKNVGLEFLSVIICYVLFLVGDTYGLINWRIMSKRQGKERALEQVGQPHGQNGDTKKKIKDTQRQDKKGQSE